MFEELFVFAEVGEEEELAGQKKEGGFDFGAFVLVEVGIDEFGNLKLVVDVVGDAVLGHVPDQLGLQLQVLQRTLEIVQIHN